MRTLVLVVATLLLLSACSPVQISSPNEPSDDRAAFTLVGIVHEPQPSVVFRAFEAGMDDCMRLVFDVPENELDDFWKASPFANSEVKLLQPHQNGASVLDRPQLPEGAEPEWGAWKNADMGWYSEAELPQARYVRIFVTVDEEKSEHRCYLFWHET